MVLREPFQFHFKGYSVWLEVEQTNGDLEEAISSAALEGGLFPIAEPHVTVAYGFTHLSEEEAKHRFRNGLGTSIKQWPALKTKGGITGTSFDGVDGEEMDMSWFEVTLATSPEHEALVDQVYSIFCDDDSEKHPSPNRAGPWQPHISLAYDNPHGSILDDVYADKVFAQYPSLLGRSERNVVAISLWRTEGRLWDWECVDKIALNAKETEDAKTGTALTDEIAFNAMAEETEQIMVKAVA